MKVMILAAGYGKRLSPITDTLPKPLIKVGKMSLIDRNINYLVHCGFHEIIINVSHHAEQIINHVNDNFPELIFHSQLKTSHLELEVESIMLWKKLAIIHSF